MSEQASVTDPFKVGWEEWVALPGLGLPALKTKIDTGARTSALHAFDIEPFGPSQAPHVRFSVHPIPGREDVTIACSAEVIDRREVTSSNGETEWRYVVRTDVVLGDRTWPIEITLTDRGSMAYRMLLGRQALADEMVVVPGESCCQGVLDYSAYHSTAVQAAAPSRTLRIAVLSREGGAYSTRRIVEEGAARGHVIEVIDTTRCYMMINPLQPEIHYDGARLPRYDAVIPRIGTSVTAYGAALMRQFEASGTYCVNGAEGIVASRDKLHAHQILSRSRIGMPATAFAASPKDTDNLIALVGNAPLVVKLLESTQGKGVVLAETRRAAQSVISAFRGLKANFLVQHFVKEAGGEDIRCMVIGGRVVATMLRRAESGEFRSNLHQGGSAEPVKITRAERDTAIRAARAFRMGLAGVDLLRAHDGPQVLEVNSSPGFEGIEKATGRNIVAALFEEIEKKVRPTVARRRSPRAEAANR
ncbi:30S ribosomal protein S6--L-glutamate ligase [Pseudooceanicola spongiae]|uniref:Probable alpha-L-glutamate ligase n=1 Tax=Pseudooceanicola spongiae TaxID=2613965 RepID=A0A7L9WLG6_9RHOB|nr:30S ribosomal protein S6--L-glutamate ligase [Pseudooceanicola spongiae]